jgi:serine protease
MRTSRRADILRPMVVAMLALLAWVPADAAPLRFDPASPPERVGVRAGRPVYRFAHLEGRVVDLAVSDGVVFRVAPGMPAPPGAVFLGGRSWRLPSASPIVTAQALAARAGIHGVFPDVLLPQAPAGGEGVYDDPSRGSQWWVDRLSMDRLWAVSPGDPDVRVAVIDSAIDIGHPDLADAVTAPYDAIDDDEDPSPAAPCGPELACDLHGTAVSGAALARGGNEVGIVGMCPACTLVPIRLLGEDGDTPLSADVRAFEHAIAAGAGVINNSWGFTESIPVPEPLAEVIARASIEGRGGLGALVVFAAGNDDRRIRPIELAALEDVLCVSATDSYGYPTNYTNAGPAVDVAAPSATVSVVPGGGVTTTFGGTSAAAPVVSGLAGWALAQDPTLTAADLRALIEGTAAPSASVPPDADGRNDVYGWGVIDPVGILETLYPPDAEAAAGCACATSADWGGGGHPLRNASPAVVALLAVRCVRRRRA